MPHASSSSMHRTSLSDMYFYKLSPWTCSMTKLMCVLDLNWSNTLIMLGCDSVLRSWISLLTDFCLVLLVIFHFSYDLMAIRPSVNLYVASFTTAYAPLPNVFPMEKSRARTRGRRGPCDEWHPHVEPSRPLSKKRTIEMISLHR